MRLRWSTSWTGSRCRPARRGIDLEQPALPATLAYRELLVRLDATPADDALTGLWVIERVYLLAWCQRPRTIRHPSVSSWSIGPRPDFATYVDALGELATPDGQDD